MSIRQIEAFQAAMEIGSIIHAADLLGIGQPAVSRLIADLEIVMEFTVSRDSAKPLEKATITWTHAAKLCPLHSLISSPGYDRNPICRHAEVSTRYDIQEDGESRTVFDLFTGEAAAIEMAPRTGLDIQDADELAELPDHKAFKDARASRQWRQFRAERCVTTGPHRGYIALGMAGCGRRSALSAEN